MWCSQALPTTMGRDYISHAYCLLVNSCFQLSTSLAPRLMTVMFGLEWDYMQTWWWVGNMNWPQQHALWEGHMSYREVHSHICVVLIWWKKLPGTRLPQTYTVKHTPLSSILQWVNGKMCESSTHSHTHIHTYIHTLSEINLAWSCQQTILKCQFLTRCFY